MSNLFVILLLAAICFVIYYFIKRKWKLSIIVLAIAVACYLIVGFLPNTSETTEEKSIQNSSVKEKKISENNSSTNYSTSQSTPKKDINLTQFGEYQFTDANIKPTSAKTKDSKLSIYFDWRNDDGIADKRSFLGSGVAIAAYQGDKELKQLSSDLSGENQKISKNTSLEINYDYGLLDSSPVTFKMVPLEGDSEEFTIDLQ